jgi:predicted RNase H-like HicB family nuclease
MNYKTPKEYKYEMTIFWSFTEQCYVGEAPELENCRVTGKTQSETFESLQKAIMEWVRRATDAEILVPQPQGRLRLKDDVYSYDTPPSDFLKSRWIRTRE